MNEILAGMGGIILVIFIALVILIPVFIYSAQRYAHKCYRELVKLNKTVESLEREFLEKSFEKTWK